MDPVVIIGILTIALAIVIGKLVSVSIRARKSEKELHDWSKDFEAERKATLEILDSGVLNHFLNYLKDKEDVEVVKRSISWEDKLEYYSCPPAKHEFSVREFTRSVKVERSFYKDAYKECLVPIARQMEKQLAQVEFHREIVWKGDFKWLATYCSEDNQSGSVILMDPYQKKVEVIDCGNCFGQIIPKLLSSSAMVYVEPLTLKIYHEGNLFEDSWVEDRSIFDKECIMMLRSNVVVDCALFTRVDDEPVVLVRYVVDKSYIENETVRSRFVLLNARTGQYAAGKSVDEALSRFKGGQWVADNKDIALYVLECPNPIKD